MVLSLKKTTTPITPGVMVSQNAINLSFSCFILLSCSQILLFAFYFFLTYVPLICSHTFWYAFRADSSYSVHAFNMSINFTSSSTSAMPSQLHAFNVLRHFSAYSTPPYKKQFHFKKYIALNYKITNLVISNHLNIFKNF